MFFAMDWKDVLLDEGSCSEIFNGYFGTIDNRPVCVFYKDGVFDYCSDEIVEFALKNGNPIIVIFNCEGFDVDVRTLRDVSKFLYRLSIANAVIPRISIFLNNVNWLMCYQSDFVIMEKNCRMSMVMPDVIKSFTGKDIEITAEFYLKSGICHLLAESDEEAYVLARKLIGYLPLNNMDDPPIAETKDDVSRQINVEIPRDSYEPFNIKDLIVQIVDDEDFFEIQSEFAKNVVIGFGRMDGSTVGIVANNSVQLLGCLDIDSIKKIISFVKFCDAFNIPIINLIDTPGYLPNFDQEINGLSYYATKLIQTYSEVTVPVISVVVRKAYGPAFIAMGSKMLGADIVYAYPNAEFAVTDIDTDLKILGIDDRERYKKMCYERALSSGFIDSIIEPKWTRAKIINALRFLETKRKKLPPKKLRL